MDYEYSERVWTKGVQPTNHLLSYTDNVMLLLTNQRCLIGILTEPETWER